MTQKMYQGKPVFGRPSQEKTIEFFKSLQGKGTVYPEDPYVTMYQFRENIYSFYCTDMTEGPEECSGSWLQLIVGPEKCLLIDTGFCFGDLKAVVERLTEGKPLIVVNTHCHFDHSGGNSLFGTICCFEYEALTLEHNLTQEQWEFERTLFQSSPFFREEDMLPLTKYEIVGCPNHTIFDLGGGHEIEMIYLPGHTSGGGAYLDKKNRILFTGDAIMCPNQNLGFRDPFHPENATVTAYAKELRELVQRMAEFDIVFSGHRKFMLPKEVVTDALGACEAILEDPNCNDCFEQMRDKLVKIKHFGHIGMTYTDEQI